MTSPIVPTHVRVVRPYEMAIVAADGAAFTGTVRHVHGLGPARRIEIALGAGDCGAVVVEVDVPREHDLTISQSIGLSPRQYRIFPPGP